MLPDAREAYPSALNCTADCADGSAARAAQRMWTTVNTFVAYTVLRIDAHVDCQERRDDTREPARCCDHEHDDHLQPRRLLHVCATEDRTGHHARYRDDARHAADTIIKRGRRQCDARRTSFG
jgi:hypothetical protein